MNFVPLAEINNLCKLFYDDYFVLQNDSFPILSDFGFDSCESGESSNKEQKKD